MYNQRPGPVIKTNRKAFIGGNEVDRFPLDIGQVGVLLVFYKYAYDDAPVFASTGTPRANTTARIFLPLPQRIEDAFGLNVGAAQLGALGAAVADVMDNKGGSLFKEGYEGLKATGAGIANLLADNGTKDVAGVATDTQTTLKYFGRSMLDKLSPALGTAVEIVGGQAVNPHTTINFDGVNLKEFTFNWQFAPRNNAESLALNNIRNQIRQNILPEYEALGGAQTTSLARAFLSYPSLMDVIFVGLDNSHYLRFKPAMVKSFNMDFSAQGNAILAGGKPAFINTTLSFMEIRPHNKVDYQGGDDTGVDR